MNEDKIMKIPPFVPVHKQELCDLFSPNMDPLVLCAQQGMALFTTDDKRAESILGWSPSALTDVDRYRIDQLLRMYVFQQGQILDALKFLCQELYNYLHGDYRRLQRQYAAFLASVKEKSIGGKWTVPYPLHPGGAVGLYDADVSRQVGPIPMLEAGYKAAPLTLAKAPDTASVGPWIMWTGVQRNRSQPSFWRLTGKGYPRDRIPDEGLYNLLDTVLAVHAELQLQSLLALREITRITDTRGRELQYLRVEAARQTDADTSNVWGGLGDITGIVAAVAGALALIPVLTPVCGPIAAVTALTALGSHVVDTTIKNDWDKPLALVGLAADALSALPGIGAVAKSLAVGRAVTKTIGAGANATYKAQVVVRKAGMAFLAETGGSGASEASWLANYIGTKGAAAVGASGKSGQIAGKVLEGSVGLATQIPLVVEKASGEDMGSAKDFASAADLTANIGQTVGSFDVVGATKKAHAVSLQIFAKVIARH
ncbi:hypothetical protein [Streptomyces sp. NPDC017230]|uniref:hypothetical protein n=2 Tax=Streptomyces TaxID=1883 RepID=UPI0037AA5371